jgi:hypothetical protein
MKSGKLGKLGKLDPKLGGWTKSVFPKLGGWTKSVFPKLSTNGFLVVIAEAKPGLNPVSSLWLTLKLDPETKKVISL